MTDRKLDPHRHEQLRDYCRRAYLRLDAGAPEEALRLFYRAWLLIPKPQTQWRESGWVLTAIGEAYLASNTPAPAIEALESALRCPGMADNPVIHLRLSQALEAAGQDELARRHLRIAHQRGGSELLKRLAPSTAIPD